MNDEGELVLPDGGPRLFDRRPVRPVGFDRMSDHCGRCRFDVKKKTGPGACPFNALHWDFLARHERRFRRNRRMVNTYAAWDKMTPEARTAMRASAADFLETLEPAKGGWARRDLSTDVI